MASRKRRTRNTVQLNLEQYITVIIGTRKTGKTTIFRDIVNEHYKGNMEDGLLLGFEKGYQALDGIVAEDIDCWEDYDRIIKDLVDDKKAELSGKPNTYEDGEPVHIPKLIAIDTIDEMVKMAEAKAIKELNRTSTTKAKTINAAGGGYGRGKNFAKGLIFDSIQLLQKAGFGIVFIGHTKIKNNKIGESGEQEYNQLTCSLTEDYTNIFLDKADIICAMKQEKSIVAGTKTAKSEVWMHFRSEGEIDCGSRFKDVPDKIQWGAQNFLHVFEQGVKSSLLKPKTDEEIAKQAEEQANAQTESIKASMENMDKTPIGDMIAEIGKNIAKASDEVKAGIMGVIKSHPEWKSINDATEADRADVEKMYNMLNA